MKDFYKDFGFIIGFLVMSLIIEMALGEKVQFYFLILVLFSMLILNSTDFVKFVDDKLVLEVKKEDE